jgi:hypothetical protein
MSAPKVYGSVWGHLTREDWAAVYAAEPWWVRAVRWAVVAIVLVWNKL